MASSPEECDISVADSIDKAAARVLEGYDWSVVSQTKK